MASRRARSRGRYQRRRAHAVLTKGRPGLLATVKGDLALVADVVTSPSRTTCPECGTRQKVRKNGTIGAHGGCVGEGKTP